MHVFSIEGRQARLKFAAVRLHLQERFDRVAVESAGRRRLGAPGLKILLIAKIT